MATVTPSPCVIISVGLPGTPRFFLEISFKSVTFALYEDPSSSTVVTNFPAESTAVIVTFFFLAWLHRQH